MKFKKFIFISLIFSLWFSLQSCNGFINHKENLSDKFTTLRISISTKNVFRAAMPALIPDEIISFVVTATNKADETKTAETNNSIQEDGKDLYQLTILPGEWTVKVQGFKTINDEDKLFLEGTKDITVSDNPTGFYDETIYVYFIENEEETGGINLPITVSDTNIAYMKVFPAEIWGDTSYPVDQGKIQFTKDEIPCGTYNSTLVFYSSDNQYIVSTMQTINIRQNFVTNTWKTTYSSEKNYINSAGNFVITNDVINHLRNTTYYVKGTGGTLLPENCLASDENFGTYEDPFASLTKAFNTILARGSSNEYTIIVDGDIEANSTISPSYSQELIINIIGTKTNPEDLTNLNCDFTIGENINLNASNIIFQNLNKQNQEFIELNINNCTVNNLLRLEYASTNIYNSTLGNMYLDDWAIVHINNIEARAINVSSTDSSTLLYISGKNTIEKLYLDETTNGNQLLLFVEGNLDGSSIGVSTGTIPTIDSPVVFTQDFSEYNETASDIFYSVVADGDNPYAVGTISSNGTGNKEAVLAISKFSFNPHILDKITIIPSENRIDYGTETAITIIAYDSNNDEIDLSTLNCKIIVKNGGAEISDSFVSIEDDNENNCKKITFSSELPAGTYSVFVMFYPKNTEDSINLVQSCTFDVEII